MLLGVGSTLAERLSESSWSAVDCGPLLENAAGIVSRERPDRLVIADAARMGLPPGERVLVSRHGLPISFFLDRLEPTERETVILGIEPADLPFGEGLSIEVNAAVEWPVGVLTAGPRDVESVAILDEIGGPEERPGEPLE